jgi:hypothetical protein
MLKRRLKDAGLSDAFSPHSFRATGITNFLENGGTLEVAQRIAGHADSRTTKLYDRRGQKVLVEDMERIRYWLSETNFRIGDHQLETGKDSGLCLIRHKPESLPPSGKRKTTHWIHRCDYNDGEGTITLRFHDDLKPALLQIKTLFARIPLKTVFRLQGGYAIRWYEMCKAKEYLATFTMSVEEVGAWLDIEELRAWPTRKP